jgi:excisionase family DNA binding protein
VTQLHTPEEAAKILKVRESWLRTKAARRAIPCTFLGKHLRFSDDDIAQIMADGERQPVTAPGRSTRRLSGHAGCGRTREPSPQTEPVKMRKEEAYGVG